MIIPTEDVIQQQNFEQLCERIKNLDIQQQSNVNDIINNNIQQYYQHYPTIPPINKLLSTQQVNLPSVNELIDYQLLIIQIKELENKLNLQNQEIAILRKENSELNEKISLLVQVEVNVQLENFFKYTNNNHHQVNNKDDRMIFEDTSNNNLNAFNSNSQGMNFQSYIPPPENITLQRSDFDNIHRELRSVANELNNDRDSLAERMNYLRNQYNF